MVQQPNIKVLKIDPAHEKISPFLGQEVSYDIWFDKYRHSGEDTPQVSNERVVAGVFEHDHENGRRWAQAALKAMNLGLWMPGGRILAGAGTSKRVTLMNCYVCREIEDSMEGIADALKDAMLTMQQGGGIGMDFSTLRPGPDPKRAVTAGAHLSRTGAVASGPLPFMDMWNSMCDTIMSAGYRRGAMMATIRDSHPDLRQFIAAKHTAGRLTNFNMSILISDAFMDAVRNDESWDLHFNVPPHDAEPLRIFTDDDGVTQFVYDQIPARELWDLILRSTYEYAEPGVIFIDRINELNNLSYCEHITCTNPCGEQPLPPNGACNLGAINLARLVENPFTPEARISWETLVEVTRIAVRFLDNVIDVTNYPLEMQDIEEKQKRRIGIGISGLANLLAQMRVRYGSREAETLTRKIMREIAVAAYEASAHLAAERGSFPLYDAEAFTVAPFVEKLPKRTRELIAKHGIRNGVLLTIAPTGTTSIYYGNISSGVEPPFAFSYTRRVKQPDGSWSEYEVQDYGYKLFKTLEGSTPPPDYLVTTQELSVEEHIRIQAACQEWVDASVSKTINCPESMSFEAFREVYDLAYAQGCKGCTTYRPSPLRGSILLSDGSRSQQDNLPKRPPHLSGVTYKVKWPSIPSSLYVTINNNDSKPFEMFIASRSTQNSEWTTALTLMISALMRTGMDISFIPEELMQVVSAHDSAWIDGKHYGSLVARIGAILKEHIDGLKAAQTQPHDSDIEATKTPEDTQSGDEAQSTSVLAAQGCVCPQCNNPTLLSSEGCNVCVQCGYSSCA